MEQVVNNVQIKVKIAAVTVNGAPITFMDIPQEYDALEVEMAARSTAAGASDNVYVFVNGNTTLSNYHSQRIAGVNNASSATEAASPLFVVGGNDYGGGGYTYIHIPNYSTTEGLKYLNVDTRVGLLPAHLLVEQRVILYANNLPVASLTIQPDGAPTHGMTGTATLYGYRFANVVTDIGA